MKHRSQILFFGIFFLIVVSCKKEEQKVSEPQTGTVTDFDGNTYQTVKIGNQWWMAENLKVKTYNDGTPINEVLATDGDSIWANQTNGAFCTVNVGYGLLYNCFTVKGTRKIAPAGWHIPTDQEWKLMEQEIGMSEEEVDKTAWRGTYEGEKLMVKSSIGWPTTSIAFGTNESGFSALPGGCRLFSGEINSASSTAFWWTSTSSGEEVWYRYLDYQKTGVFRQHTYKRYGMSVRCVKD